MLEQVRRTDREWFKSRQNSYLNRLNEALAISNVADSIHPNHAVRWSAELVETESGESANFKVENFSGRLLFWSSKSFARFPD